MVGMPRQHYLPTCDGIDVHANQNEGRKVGGRDSKRRARARSRDGAAVCSGVQGQSKCHSSGSCVATGERNRWKSGGGEGTLAAETMVAAANGPSEIE